MHVFVDIYSCHCGQQVLGHFMPLIEERFVELFRLIIVKCSVIN